MKKASMKGIEKCILDDWSGVGGVVYSFVPIGTNKEVRKIPVLGYAWGVDGKFQYCGEAHGYHVVPSIFPADGGGRGLAGKMGERVMIW
jgi:hypothetical protein